MTAHKKREEKTSEMVKRAARFAERELSGRTDLDGRTIPPDVWQKMGRRGLLGWGIPAAYGGGGAGFSHVLPAMEAFVRAGASPGLALSWMVHVVAAKVLVEGAADSRRKKELLPEMASGRSTVSIALSEPGAGSDPRRIGTTASKRRGGYLLDGQKTWLTNGPLADRYVVFAVEGEREGRKAFTAFVVPKHTAGLTVLEMPPLGFLRPSPHCGIRLESCFVPGAAVLGRRGRAWEDLSKPFRIAEDTLLAGVLIGAMSRELGLLIGRIGQTQGKAGTGEKERVGATAAWLAAARRVSLDAARALDGRGDGGVAERRLVAVHSVLQSLQEALGAAHEAFGLERAGDQGSLADDVARLFGLGSPADRARRRKWGETILTGKETP